MIEGRLFSQKGAKREIFLVEMDLSVMWLLNTKNDKYMFSSVRPTRSATYCLIYWLGIACYAKKKKKITKFVTVTKITWTKLCYTLFKLEGNYCISKLLGRKARKVFFNRRRAGRLLQKGRCHTAIGWSLELNIVSKALGSWKLQFTKGWGGTGEDNRNGRSWVTALWRVACQAGLEVFLRKDVCSFLLS